MRWMFGLCAMVALAGCAQLQELSCANTDPLALGERLGRQGATQTDLSQEVAWCAQTSSPLRLDLVERGFAAGRRAYCTPSVAFENGEAGRPLRAICPREVMWELTEAHNRGQLVREIDRDLADAYRQLERLEARLRDHRNAQESGEDGQPSAADGRAIRRDIRRITRRIERLEDRKFLLRAAF
ncbi:MAG: DUF2799 domain-containing protein [Pseudomonadota bacterium]